MPLIVRQHSYVTGALIIASQNNANENTLYNLVNGNLDADNFSALAEALITFDTVSGHEHDGSDSKKIDISGVGPLLQCATTATDHAIIGTSSSSGTHAGIRGTASAATAYGGSFDHTSTGSSLLVDGSGGGNPLLVRNNSGAVADDAIEVMHRGTTSGKAAILISQATATGYGIHCDEVDGVGIFVDHASATTAGIQVDAGDRAIVLNARTNSVTNSQIFRIDSNSKTGVTPPANEGWVHIEGNGIAFTGTGSPLVQIDGGSSVTGTSLDVFHSASATDGTTKAAGWAVAVMGGPGENSNSLFVGGRLALDGDLAHLGLEAGFFSTAPITKPTVSGSRSGNVALASLCTQLANLGLITDSTS